MESLPEVIDAIVEAAEWVKTGGVLPAGRTALGAYLKRRAAAAQQILFEELLSGGNCPSKWRLKTTASP